MLQKWSIQAQLAKIGRKSGVGSWLWGRHKADGATLERFKNLWKQQNNQMHHNLSLGDTESKSTLQKTVQQTQNKQDKKTSNEHREEFWRKVNEHEAKKNEAAMEWREKFMKNAFTTSSTFGCIQDTLNEKKKWGATLQLELTNTAIKSFVFHRKRLSMPVSGKESNIVCSLSQPPVCENPHC